MPLRVLDRPYPSREAKEPDPFGEAPPRNMWGEVIEAQQPQEKAQEQSVDRFSQESMVRTQYTQFAKIIIKKCADNTPVESIRSYIARGAAKLNHVNGELPGLLDAAEFSSRDPMPLPGQIIHRLFHQRTKMLVGGASKSWKTWTLMDVNISVACGADWWGFPTRQGKVCYINLELQPEFFENRFNRICDVKGVRPDREMFKIWNLRGYAKPMKELIREVLPQLAKQHFSLVTFDPIYKTLPPYRGSENDSAIITQLLNDLDSITVNTGAAVLFSSHYSKGNQAEKESLDRVSGSGAWIRDPDSLLMMTAHQEQDCFSVDATLRNLPPLRSFVVKWDYPLFTRQEKLDPELLKKHGGRPQTADPEKLLSELSDETGQEPKTVIKRMKDQYDIARSSVYRMKDALTERGVFIADQNGLWWKTAQK